MKASELRQLSQEELRQKEKELRQKVHELTLQRFRGELDKPHLLQQARKDIARIQTILNEKKEKKNG